MMGKVSCALRRLGIACAFLVLLTGCDWTSLGFGPANTNFNPSEPALTESSVQHLEVAWSAPCACTRAIVGGGRVYVVDGYSGSQPYSLTLRAFDATTGQPRWSTPLGASQFGDVLSAVANGLVYVVVQPKSGSDRIVALEMETGAVRWQMTPPPSGSDPVRLTSPIIVDGPLAFVAASGSTRSDIVAIDRDGHIVWSAAPGGYVSSLAADPENHILYASSLLYQTSGPSLQLLNGYGESDGTLRSAVHFVTTPISFDPLSSLGFSRGLVFATQPNDHGEGGVGALAVHPDTGVLAWTGDGKVTALTPRAVVDFARGQNPNTIARNPATGAVLWQANTGRGAEAVAGDLVYTQPFIGSTGIIDVRRLSDGSVVASVPVPGAAYFSALTPSAGHVYGVDGTRLYALAPA